MKSNNFRAVRARKPTRQTDRQKDRQRDEPKPIFPRFPQKAGDKKSLIFPLTNWNSLLHWCKLVHDVFKISNYTQQSKPTVYLKFCWLFTHPPSTIGPSCLFDGWRASFLSLEYNFTIVQFLTAQWCCVLLFLLQRLFFTNEETSIYELCRIFSEPCKCFNNILELKGDLLAWR